MSEKQIDETDGRQLAKLAQEYLVAFDKAAAAPGDEQCQALSAYKQARYSLANVAERIGIRRFALGDRVFQAYVNREHDQPVVCHDLVPQLAKYLSE